MTTHAHDSELSDLEPIIGELLELLEPHVMAPTFRRALLHGAHVRTVVVPNVDVDVVALARFVRDWSGSDSLSGRARRLLANRPGEALTVDEIADGLNLSGDDRKPLYNALSGLARRGKIEQVGYGRYRIVIRATGALKVVEVGEVTP